MKCYIERVTTNSDVTTDIKLLIPDLSVRRRMSQLLRTTLTTAIECMKGIENINSLDAIITATGWGCLADSEKFLRNIIVNDEQLLNSTPFIQSTFNTIGGQIALLSHNHCYNMTYVNRSHSFEDALLDAMMRLADDESENILIGAFDEQTPSQHRIMERTGLFRKYSNGEGVVFAHLSRQKSNESIAQITTIDFPQQTLSQEECKIKYATTENAVMLWNNYQEYGNFPTASALCFAKAVDMVIDNKVEEVIVYNEYLGAKPTVFIVKCIG